MDILKKWLSTSLSLVLLQETMGITLPFWWLNAKGKYSPTTGVNNFHKASRMTDNFTQSFIQSIEKTIAAKIWNKNPQMALKFLKFVFELSKWILVEIESLKLTISLVFWQIRNFSIQYKYLGSSYPRLYPQRLLSKQIQSTPLRWQQSHLHSRCKWSPT